MPEQTASGTKHCYLFKSHKVAINLLQSTSYKQLSLTYKLYGSILKCKYIKNDKNYQIKQCSQDKDKERSNKRTSEMKEIRKRHDGE